MATIDDLEAEAIIRIRLETDSVDAGDIEMVSIRLRIPVDLLTRIGLTAAEAHVMVRDWMIAAIPA